MNDHKELIERLRDSAALPTGLYMEAAEAIERLSAEVEAAGKDFDAARNACDHWFEQAEKFSDELTALRAQLAQQEPAVAFTIYKPTQPRGREIEGSLHNDSLPWVYDQSPDSGYVASMRVVPVAHLSRSVIAPQADAKDAARKIVASIVDATLDELDEPNRVRKAVFRIMRKKLDAAMQKGGS